MQVRHRISDPEVAMARHCRCCGIEVREQAACADWASLERGSGASRADMERFAALLRDAKSAVFVWSMGITQHAEGVDNVQAIVNLALARGFVGQPSRQDLQALTHWTTASSR